MPRGDLATAKRHRDWLKQISKHTGKSLTKLASETGLAVSTLTRPVKEGDAGTSTLHANTIAKLSSYTGIAPPGGGETMLPPARRPLRGFQDDAEPYKPDKADALADAVSSLMGGRTDADPWTIKSRALELAGYLPGDVVILDLSAEPQQGEIVCAQANIDPRGMTSETVMRIYERAGAADVLVAASMDPAWRQPVPVDDRVAIKGVVIGMVRPTARAG